MKKVVSLVLSIVLGVAFLVTPQHSFSRQQKTQIITISNITDRDMVITIKRPEAQPCNDIQEKIKDGHTKDYTISSACPLTHLIVLDTRSRQEKSITQLTYGAYTKFLIELNKNNTDDIVITPFIAEEQSWDKKVEQAKERLEEKKRQARESYITQI